MVDAEDLMFGKIIADDVIELARGGEVAAERLFHDDARGRRDKTIMLQLVGNIAEQGRRNRKIEGAHPARFRIVEESCKFAPAFVSFGIDRNVMQPLQEFFDLNHAAEADSEHTVAWIDCLAAQPRGILIAGNHAADGAPLPAPAQSLRVPLTPPFSPINGPTLRAFNAAYFHRPLVQGRVHFAPFFYPLDGIRDWNRMYGPNGFLQHQCVLPPALARDAVAALLGEIGRSGQGSFLAVLKEFGDRPAPGLLSFARPGTTLALDFPHRGPEVFALLDRLDAIVASAGGALYPAKDARMSPAMFRAGQPRLDAFIPHIDPAFSSSFWRRVME